ncbi:MAG: DUF485 domain-containing protein [Pseudomonadota bacterium]
MQKNSPPNQPQNQHIPEHISKSAINWQAIESDPRFQDLHRDKNRFLWRMMLFALVFYFSLPIATAYFQSILTVKIWGVINVGLLFALSQFIVAWCIAAIYAKRANAEFDSRAKILIEDAHNIKGAR